MGYIQSCAFVFHHFIPLQVDRKLLLRVCSLTGNAPDLVGVVPFQNLKRSGHLIFKRKKEIQKVRIGLLFYREYVTHAFEKEGQIKRLL